MNKSKVEELIPKAVDALKITKIAKENDEINKSFRGQISTFGASIMNGSLLAAVAFFSERGTSDVDRVKLTKAIYLLINPEDKDSEDKGTLFEYVKNQIEDNNEVKCREDILNAAIALKLAMNVYILK